MRISKKRSSDAFSSNVLTGLIVGSFVGIVVIALVLSFIGNPTPSKTQITVQGLTLFGGSPSSHSYNLTCQGDAMLEISIENPTLNPVHVTRAVIYGSSLPKNATVLLSGTNSCLNISEVNPTIEPSLTYQFNGFVSASLQFGISYNYLVEFDNGQNLTGLLIAQS